MCEQICVPLCMYFSPRLIGQSMVSEHMNLFFVHMSVYLP